MAQLMPPIKARFFDANNNPLSGGKVYAYRAGSQTPLDTFTDLSEATKNDWPVTLDAEGSGDIWLSNGIPYKIAVEDSTGAPRYSTDNITGVGASGSGSSLGTVFVSGLDPVAGFLSTKLIEGDNITLDIITNVAGDSIQVNAVLDGKVSVNGGDTSDYLIDKFIADDATVTITDNGNTVGIKVNLDEIPASTLQQVGDESDESTSNYKKKVGVDVTFEKSGNTDKILTIADEIVIVDGELHADSLTGDGSAITGLTKDQVGLGNVENVAASDTYLPLNGGNLTGALNGTSASFTGSGTFGGNVIISNGSLQSATVGGDINALQLYNANTDGANVKSRTYVSSVSTPSSAGGAWSSWSSVSDATFPGYVRNYLGVGGSFRVYNAGSTVLLDVTESGNATVVGSGTFSSIVKSGGTSSQFLKADGSVDSSTYMLSTGGGNVDFGASHIGTWSNDGNYSRVGHKDFNTASNYGMIQHGTTGDVIMKAPSITLIGAGGITLVGALVSSSSGTFSSIVKSGGTSSQFLKADGSVDSNSYLTETGTEAVITSSTTYTINNLPRLISVNSGTATTVTLPDAASMIGTVVYVSCRYNAAFVYHLIKVSSGGLLNGASQTAQIQMYAPEARMYTLIATGQGWKILSEYY